MMNREDWKLFHSMLFTAQNIIHHAKHHVTVWKQFDDFLVFSLPTNHLKCKNEGRQQRVTTLQCNRLNSTARVKKLFLWENVKRGNGKAWLLQGNQVALPGAYSDRDSYCPSPPICVHCPAPIHLVRTNKKIKIHTVKLMLAWFKISWHRFSDF